MRLAKTFPRNWSPDRRLAALAALVLLGGGIFRDSIATKRHPDSGDQVDLSQPLVVQWRYDSTLTGNLTPATDTRRVYVPLSGGILVGLNASDGQLQWKSETGGELSASPVVDERSVYLASEYGDVSTSVRSTQGALRALSSETGVTLWMRTLPMPIRGALAASNTTLFGGAADGRVYAFDKNTGLTRWVNQYSSGFSSQPVLSGSFLYVGSEDGALYAIDQATGRTLWRYRTRGAVRGPAAVDGRVVYFGSGDGYVYAVGESGKRLRWRMRTGAGVQAVSSVNGGLLVASLDNFVYFLSLTNGNRIWKHQLPGRISSQPLTARDAALFTPLTSDSGVVLALRDGRQVNSLPIGEENNSTGSPISAGDLVLVTTPHALLAFAPRKDKP